jgi:hypothetical protein
MERKQKSIRNINSTIQTPSFPNLNDFPFLLVAQYGMGRKAMADKVNHLLQYLQNEIDIFIAPSVNVYTEPYQYMEWIYECLCIICQTNNLTHNFQNYITDHEEFKIDKVDDYHSFCGYGTTWYNKIKPNYRKWLEYFTAKIIEFGAPTVWDILDHYGDPENTVMSHEEIETIPDKEEKEQYLELYYQYQKDYDTEMANQIYYDGNKPKKLAKPRNKKEKELHSFIADAINLFENLENENFYFGKYTNEYDLNDGLLDIASTFMIFGEYYNCSDYISKIILDDYIDERANQVGICKILLQNKNNSVLDMDELDLSNFYRLCHFAETMQEYERQYDK